jgi:hypothetical protein
VRAHGPLMDARCGLSALGSWAGPISVMNGKGSRSMGKGSVSRNALCYYVIVIAIITIILWELLSIKQIIQK